MKILASSSVSNLTGNGLEYLLDKTGEFIRAVFFNGKMETAAACGNLDDTKVISLPDDRAIDTILETCEPSLVHNVPGCHYTPLGIEPEYSDNVIYVDFKAKRRIA